MAHTFAAAEVLTAANLGARINWSDWTAVSFTNSWVNYGAPYQEVQYRKVGDEVTVRGVMKSGTSGTVAFTLPSGFRPPASQQFTANGPNVFAYLNIDNAGQVTATCATGTTAFTVEMRFSVTA